MKATAVLCAAFFAAISIAQASSYTGSLPPHSRIRTVGIISAIGDTFLFEHIRPGAFEWIGPPAASFLEISDWGLDDLVMRETAAALAKNFSGVPVTFEEADFDTWTYATLARSIRALPLPDNDIDAYILILRDWRRDGIGHSVHQVAGLGLYRRDQRPVVGVFASYRIVIVDARTSAIIASRAALLPDGKLPWMPADPSLWPKTQNDLNEAQKVILRNDLSDLIDSTLVQTLRDMKLAK